MKVTLKYGLGRLIGVELEVKWLQTRGNKKFGTLVFERKAM